jgi:hypothetical protein
MDDYRMRAWSMMGMLLLGGQACAAPLELAGVTVTPHVHAESMRYRRPPEPDMAARVQLFIRNTSTESVTIRSDADLRFDDVKPLDLRARGQWAWHDTPDCWPGENVTLEPQGITVWTFNGRTDTWGPDTRHRLTVDQDGERWLEAELDLKQPKVWLSSVAFVEPSGFYGSILLHVANEGEVPLSLDRLRVSRSASPATSRSLQRAVERQGPWSVSGSVPVENIFAPRDRGWAQLPAIGGRASEVPISHLVLEAVLKTPGERGLRGIPGSESLSLWAQLRVRWEAFDISGGWVAGDVNGRQALTLEPYLKTLKCLHVNTGHIGEIPGYTDNPDLYSAYPLKYFNKLQPFEVYDQPRMRRRIHAVEFLGEPQYGGGRPVPPQEVFRELQPYQFTRLPTTVTHSEERTWRWYAGLSDYAHYDAYRVRAPAADKWQAYDRWGGERIRWGAPLETIGDMTRSLREMYRPASIAYWSQGAHAGWSRYGRRRRTSPTPDELRMQAYHALASRVTSLYWFNLSLRSLLKFPDLLKPIQRVGREVRLLEDFYMRGDACSYRRLERDGRPDWDLSVIGAPGGALLFALDLDYYPDPEEKVFQFRNARPAEFAYRLPGYARNPVDVFRVDADGVYEVDYEVTADGVEVRDTLSRVGIYVATRDEKLRARLEWKRRGLVETEKRAGFDPVGNPVDFGLLKGLLELPVPRARKRRLGSARVDAAFVEYLLRERAARGTVGASDGDLRDTMEAFSKWKRETADGRWWGEWSRALLHGANP